jgi:CubicO group peptidase (beta-lactamase class C family)
MGTDSYDNWDRLCEFVVQVMARKGIPGVAVGLLHAGGVNTACFGVTSVENPLPVTDTTLFQIGSITKTFVGTVVMRLVEMGELDLDATVRTYLPGFRVADEAASAQVTVRHLLIHTGGWEGDFFYDTGAGENALAEYVVAMVDLEQLAPIGTIWTYNNAGFVVAGRIVEVVTGKRFEEALRELVLEPLGLDRTFFDPADVLTHRFVVGHDVIEEEPRVSRPWALPRSAYPAGGITCDVRDLMRYARFHLGDGTVPDDFDGEAETVSRARLLSPESMAQMRSTQATIWEGEAWGLSWAINDIGGMRQVSHGGGTLGQISQLALLPQRNLAVAVLTNADRGGTVTQPVVKWVLKEYLGLEKDEPEPAEASEEELAQYVGHYANPFSDVDIGLLGGRLVGQTTYKKGFPDQDSPPLPSPPPASLAMCDKDRLLVMDGPDKGDTAEILRRSDGSIGWLRVGRIHVREEK